MTDYMDARTRERLKALCKLGRLFDAQRLLEEVGTARLRKTRKWTPLFTAVERGFHSLVELLLRFDHAQWDLDKAYERAQRKRRADLATLILSAPSWSAPIDPVDVLATGDVALAWRLHDTGTDFTGGDTILRGAMRNASGTLKIVEELNLSSREVEAQLYSAMVSHASLGHVASVIRFLRSGFDPHRAVRYLDERGRLIDEEDTAIHVAMFSNKPGLVAALKPRPDKDDSVSLIRSAMLMGDERLLRILLDAGFTLNCKPNGGSPAIDEVLTGSYLGGGRFYPNSETFRAPRGYLSERAQRLLDALRTTLEMGARWVPDPKDTYQLRCIRDTFLALGEDFAKQAIHLLRQSEASEDDILFLFRTPRMRDMGKAVL